MTMTGQHPSADEVKHEEIASLTRVTALVDQVEAATSDVCFAWHDFIHGHQESATQAGSMAPIASDRLMRNADTLVRQITCLRELAEEIRARGG